jgi:hypothetical protein
MLVVSGAVVVVLVLLTAGLVVPGPQAPAVSTAYVPPPSSLLYFPTRITHVVVIVFENSAASNAFANGSFFRYLAEHYAYATSDYAICHPSAPNYLALTSGATYSQCGSDTHHVYSATNIADELDAKKLTWDGFMESMPKACDTTDSYPYMVKHDPFLFYKDIVNNTARCDAHVLSLNNWTQDVNTSKIPNYSFITPNMKNDGHDTTVSYASNWLHGFLTPLVNDSWFASTAFFITFDEGANNIGAGATSAGPTNSTGGGNIYLSIVGPTSLGVGNLSKLASQYSVMTTIEWLLGLSSTGHQDKTSNWPALKAAFP